MEIVEPNQKVSEMTLPELKAMLGVCYSLYLGINLEEKKVENMVNILCDECFRFHRNLYVWKLRELFFYYAKGLLEGMENVKPEIHSLFIHKMKISYFTNPGKVREKLNSMNQHPQNPKS